MAEIHTPDSSISKISELDFGAVRYDVSDPERRKQLMGNLYQDNPLVAKLLLSEAEQAGEGSDTASQAFIEGGLTIYDLIRRQEEDLRLRATLGFNAVNDDGISSDTLAT